MTLQITDIEPGEMIAFRSKNANDTVMWQGVLESTGTYRSIRGIDNPAAYNEAVRQSDNTVPTDVTLLTYFVITVDNDADVPSTKVFATEWVEPGSLARINLGNKVKLLVSDPHTDTPRILSILAAAGYATKIISE